MKKKGVVLVVSVLALAGPILLWADKGQTMMSVQVKQGVVRSTPSFVGQVVGSLNYGERVTVLEQQPGWIRVSASGLTGWMHQSALTSKRIVLTASGTAAPTGASTDELALAGKGFNSDVEAQFKAQNREVDFEAVDRMEKRKATPEEISAFLAEGGVRPGKGGAQ